MPEVTPEIQQKVAPVQLTPEKTPNQVSAAANAAVQEQIQPVTIAPTPAVAPVAVMPIRAYAVTIGDNYPVQSIQYDNPEYRQVYYYNAQNEAEVLNKLREQYPDIKKYTIQLA